MESTVDQATQLVEQVLGESQNPTKLAAYLSGLLSVFDHEGMIDDERVQAKYGASPSKLVGDFSHVEFIYLFLNQVGLCEYGSSASLPWLTPLGLEVRKLLSDKYFL